MSHQPDGDFTRGAAWMHGRILPIGEAKIGVTDWALTHSDVTYDVVPVWKNGFFRLQDYLDRFEASMAALRLDPGVSRGDIAQALHDMVAASGLESAYCAMVCARGPNPVPGSRDPRDCRNHFYAWCVPYVHVVAEEVADRGVAVHMPRNVHRISPKAVNPRVKNYHWGDFTAGLFAAKDAGFETVILADAEGNVTEGPGFNAFFVFGDTLCTAGDGVLHGITRRTVIEMAEAAGLRVVEGPLPCTEALEADEVFLSSSGGGVIPVTRIDERVFGNGAPGPVGARLRRAYFDWLMRDDLRTPVRARAAG